MTLLEQCQCWHENDEYKKIIDALEALPAAERTPETDSELARAYNNIAELGDKELFRKALDLLKPHEEYFAEDHCWNFRIAYAYFYLDKEYLALPYFEKALAARPGDEDTQQFIDECHRLLALPKFAKSFRQRTQEAWETFLAEEGELRRLLDHPERENLGDFLVGKCQSILQLAFDNIAFELGRGGEKYELILTPEGDGKQLFSLAYFQKYAPPQILQRWNIIVGRQPSDNNALRSDGWDINGNDVQIWPTMRGDKRIALELYCAKLTPLLSENENRAWWLLSTLTDLTIGEIPAIAYIEFFNVLPAPKPEASLTLSELPQFLRDRDFDLNLTAQDFLDNNYIGYELKAEEDPDVDWRLDTFIGSTRLPVLINEYLRGDSDAMNAFHDDGAVPGFLCYPLNGFTDDDRAKAILDFRDALEKSIVERTGSEAAVTFLGGATGLYCGYLDFIAWDLPAVLDAAKEFLQSANLSWANFHSFRRYTGAVRLLEREENTQAAPKIHEETGSLLSPQDIETLQSFDDGVSGYFYKMFSYLENFVKEGVASGAFTERQVREDLQIANWYAFAANNLDAYKYYYKVTQWMPASEKNAQGCATWYYRYSAALMYCGQLERALQYAERGALEEPDYPWVWLQVAKLRNHFCDKAGALDAVQQGLKAVPGDYEFLTLRQEIEAGDSLERMEYHWINPDADRTLQEGLDEDADAKQRAIACIRTDDEGLKRFQELFNPQPTDYTKNNPYCRFAYPVNENKVDINFCMNEAGLSKMNANWLKQFKERLDSGQWLAYTAPDGNTGTLAAAFINQDYHISLAYHLPDSDEHFQIYLRPNGSQIEDAFWSSYDTQAENAQNNNKSENPQAEAKTESAAGNTGKFCGFVLLADAHFDKRQFIHDMQEKWDITVDDDDNTSDVLLFSVGSLTATVSLMPAPIPGDEAESNAQNNYLWPEAVETAKAHQAHLLVAVFDKEKNLLECGKLYAKLLAACCRQPNATGVYTSGVVFQPRFYEGFADMLKEDRLPIFNWIWFGLYRSENGVCGYTYGMDVFGKEEMEVLDADAEPNEVRDFLSSLAAYVLECDATLQNGETIGFSAEDKHSITRSPGVALPQQTTLKISYAPLEAGHRN